MEDMLQILLDRKIVVPVLVIVFSVLLYVCLKKIIKKLLLLKLKGVRVNDRRHKTTISLIDNVLKYFIAIVALLMILDVYGVDTKSLIASLGVFSLVAGLALQDFLKDIIAGITIIFEDQYAVGDVVTVGTFKGTVSYLGIKSTRITAYTGEVLIIANRNIDKVINHTLEKNISILDIPVAYDTDIDNVKRILTSVCKELQKELNLNEAKVCGLQSFDDSSMAIRLVFAAKYGDKFGYEQIFNERIKKAFDENNIEIPFQQVVIHNGK